MDKLKTTDLLSLEEYDKQREDIKKDLLSHKKNRSVLIGDNVVLLFEDYLTIKYQVQEMLRIEKIFNQKEIQEEIDAYSSLIPDGDNLKATMLIMYPDVDERKIMLNKLHNLENLIWLSIDGSKKIIAVSDEDLERTRDEKTSAVHFLRFQLTKSDIKLFKASENIEFGVNHDNYNQSVKISKDTILALSNDLDG
ncbi:MAG: Uncharacterised protein [Gammaproteobacteria bacterium]|nr:MAG: Uncharacterised protein [Gammaproteobacteria bacterium]|tara:strand:- start:69 stop:653 length:585 start_codon:yes stop_codon:yes gene_type:complete